MSNKNFKHENGGFGTREVSFSVETDRNTIHTKHTDFYKPSSGHSAPIIQYIQLSCWSVHYSNNPTARWQFARLTGYAYAQANQNMHVERPRPCESYHLNNAIYRRTNYLLIHLLGLRCKCTNSRLLKNCSKVPRAICYTIRSLLSGGLRIM